MSAISILFVCLTKNLKFMQAFWERKYGCFPESYNIILLSRNSIELFSPNKNIDAGFLSLGHECWCSCYIIIGIFLLSDLLQNPQVDHLYLDKTWVNELW